MNYDSWKEDKCIQILARFPRFSLVSTLRPSRTSTQYCVTKTAELSFRHRFKLKKYEIVT